MEAQFNEQAPVELIASREQIKLTKNSRGYGWEIRIFADEKAPDDVKLIERLEKLNNDLKEKFEYSIE